MTNTQTVVDKIIRKLKEEPFQDLSDVGNLIGIALGEAEVPDLAQDGNDLSGFRFGLDHGLDLAKNYKEPPMGVKNPPLPPAWPTGMTVKEWFANWCPRCGSSRIRKYLLFGKSRCIHTECPDYGKYL